MIDTHCHLDVAAFDADREAVVARAAAAGVTGVIVPAIRPRTWRRLAELAAAHTGAVDLRIAIGVHPQIVGGLADDELPRDGRGEVDANALADAIVRAVGELGDRVIAVGECGLDGGSADRDGQAAVLRANVRAARVLRKPLILHVLRGHDDAVRILREEGAREVGGVLHSYSGSAALVPVYADLGLAFSFAGPVTYPNARHPVAAARAVPRELLLAETDAPDQTPAPHRGRRNEPAFVAEVVARLAAVRSEPIAAVRELTAANARRVFRWVALG